MNPPHRLRPTGSTSAGVLSALLMCTYVHAAGQHGCPISADELQQRAAPWPHLRVKEITADPPTYHLSGLLTPAEVAELVGLATQGMKTHQDNRAAHHSTIALDRAPVLNNSRAIQSLNRRLSALAGLPETHIEDGYFSVYNSGYEMKSLHLDNHHVLIEPRRVLSYVIYLHVEDDFAGTVFPLAKTDAPDVMAQQYIDSWNARIARDSFKMGMFPQEGRICTAKEARCIDMLKHAHSLCSSGGAPAMDPGDAVMFYQYSGSVETIRGFHAGCPMRPSKQQQAKVVLAKFVRSAPRPFRDENDFIVALNAHRAKFGKRALPMPPPPLVAAATDSKWKRELLL